MADAHHVTARVPDCLPLYEERMETCLLEMRILRQCLSKSELAHDAGTEAVGEGISVIIAYFGEADQSFRSKLTTCFALS